MIRILSLMMFLVIGRSSFANKNITDTIEVAYNKEVILLFDSPITEHIISVDPSQPDVLFEKHDNKGVIQAAIPFKQTYNLFIETEVGEYMFILKYNENPSEFFYSFSESESLTANKIVKSVVKQKQNGNNTISTIDEKNVDDKIKINAKKSFDESRQIDGIGSYFKKMIFDLSAIWVDEEHIYFALDVQNQSQIDYNIDFVKFVVRNKKKALKTAAIQEETIPTEYIYEKNAHLISGQSKEKLVYAFQKFTIHPSKLLHVELWEKGGDRKVEFTLNANELLKAKSIR